MSFRGAIFDLDGVLVDTVPLHFQAWQAMFALYGIGFDLQDYLDKVDGKTRMDGVRAMMPDASEAHIQTAADTKQTLFAERLDTDLKAFDSSVAFVRRLNSAGLPLAVASSSVNIRPILERAGILDCFGSIVSAAEINLGKPNPEIFLTAAAELHLRPECCVVFEDAEAGVEAAIRGGFYCIGVIRYGGDERLSNANARISDLGEVDTSRLFGV